MKKNILVAAALIATLSTGAFAYNQNKGDCNGMYKQQNNTQMQKNCMNDGMQKGMKKGMKQGMNKKGMKKHGRDGMRMFAQLNLTDEQRFEMSILKDEMKLEMKKSRGFKKQYNIVQFITEDGFNTEEFKKFASENQTKKLNLKADFMEKAVKLLTKEQLVQLKLLASR